MPCIRRFALPGNPVIFLSKGRDAGVSLQSSPKRVHPPFSRSSQSACSPDPGLFPLNPADSCGFRRRTTVVDVVAPDRKPVLFPDSLQDPVRWPACPFGVSDDHRVGPCSGFLPRIHMQYTAKQRVSPCQGLVAGCPASRMLPSRPGSRIRSCGALRCAASVRLS